MSTRNQIILALSLAVGAVVVVAAFGSGQEGQGGGGDPMEGHDHSAMAAADEAQPVQLDAEASRRIGVTYATVTRGSLPRTVRSVGFVTYDETRLATVNPKIDGWVERLFVDFNGAPVRAGQPLMEVYSPALVTAQEELLLARRLMDETRAAGGVRSVERAEELLAAARRRLAYWDVSDDEIRAIEERGSVTKTLTLRAPAGGIVIEKDVVAGVRIMPGMNLYRIADLSRVWVNAEVFEKDLSLVQDGQHAMVSFEAYPGETFHGSVTYVYPTVSSSARTGRVRLELSNPDLKLKPGMYAQVDLHGPPIEDALLVPRSAVLQTGERSVVFHSMPDGQLHPMDVVTGIGSGDQIQILSGVREGHVVVASATFLIDAESNLGSAMAAMAGMDHGAMDHSGMDPGEAGTEEMDHSGHVMPPDTTSLPDTGAVLDHSQMDHSGHVMPPDTASLPDTTGAAKWIPAGSSQGAGRD
jgi:RND family efflux transporter MFP subunit